MLVRSSCLGVPFQKLLKRDVGPSAGPLTSVPKIKLKSLLAVLFSFWDFVQTAGRIWLATSRRGLGNQGAL